MLRLQTEVDESTDREFVAGPSPGTRAILDLVQRIAKLSATVLILGESGTGKELLARLIHRGIGSARLAPSSRSTSRPFRESSSRACSSATRRARSPAPSASRLASSSWPSGGTLFLDEIGDLRPELQAKLLRAIQEGEIERIGSQRPVPTDFRLIAATHVDLEKAMKDGRFREDLFYRLNVVPLKVPPLRERAEDIPELARFFLRRYSTRFRKQMRGISEGMLRTLQAYWWPGNIRELENLIERLVAITDKEWLTEEDLPFEFLFAQLDAQPAAGQQPLRGGVPALRAQLHPARAREERLERDRHGAVPRPAALDAEVQDGPARRPRAGEEAARRLARRACTSVAASTDGRGPRRPWGRGRSAPASSTCAYFRGQDGVLQRLGDAGLDDRLRRDLDRLARRGVAAHAGLPLLDDELHHVGQRELTGALQLLLGERRPARRRTRAPASASSSNRSAKCEKSSDLPMRRASAMLSP